MTKFLKSLLLISIVFVSSPERLLGFCTEGSESPNSQYQTVLMDSAAEFYVDYSAEHQSGDTHDCSCPVHSHHCCSHFSLGHLYKSIKVQLVPKIKTFHSSFSNQFISEHYLDGLLRPPIA